MGRKTKKIIKNYNKLIKNNKKLIKKQQKRNKKRKKNKILACFLFLCFLL